jgi:hypothetical protein
VSVLFAVACAGSPEIPAEPEAILCPELGSNVDVLELPYSDDPLANGRLKAFVATARGLADAVIETERLAIDACQRIARDLGFPERANPASIQEACAPVSTTIQRLASSGIEIRISLVTPRCGPDQRREARCAAVCPASGKECAVLCSAQAALYAQCTLSAVSVAVSSELDEAKKLARSLEEHVPALLYAEIALGKRLVAHTEQIAFVSARLPGDLKNAGPRGMACATLAAATTGKAIARLKQTVTDSAATLALLDPMEYPAGSAAP